MKLLRDPSDTYNKGIFVRPGMHYGLFAKLNGGCFSWDWWTQEEGKDHPTFWTMTTDHLGQAIWDEITFIVTHYAEQKKFELYIRNEYTGDTIRRNQTYKGELHDYTSAPFHFGFCNYYEGIIPGIDDSYSSPIGERSYDNSLMTDYQKELMNRYGPKLRWIMYQIFDKRSNYFDMHSI